MPAPLLFHSQLPWGHPAGAGAAPRGALPAWGSPTIPATVLPPTDAVSGVRPANAGVDRDALGTVSKGKGTGPWGQEAVAVHGEWLETGEGNLGGEARLFLASCRAAFCIGHRCSQLAGISGSSSHQY